MVGCVPHIGQSGFLRSFNSRKRMASASNSSSRAIDDDVVVLQNIQRVVTREMRIERINLNVRIQATRTIGSGFNFRTADIFSTEQNLTLQVAVVDPVKID